jgi:hypothetical protein
VPGATTIDVVVGELTAETSATAPLAVRRIVLAAVRRAQAEYPCYVEE